MPHIIQQLVPYLGWGAIAASLIGPVVSAVLSTMLGRVAGRASETDSARDLVGAGATQLG